MNCNSAVVNFYVYTLQGGTPLTKKSEANDDKSKHKSKGNECDKAKNKPNTRYNLH